MKYNFTLYVDDDVVTDEIYEFTNDIEAAKVISNVVFEVYLEHFMGCGFDLVHYTLFNVEEHEHVISAFDR